MRTRLGGLLVAALGAVLISGGLTSAPAANVGAAAPTCGGEVAGFIGEAPLCPEGAITFDEQDKVVEGTAPTAPPQARRAKARPHVEPTSPPTPPSTWTVTVSSDNCTIPNGSATTYQVPDTGSKVTDALEIFTDTSENTTCNYNYVETAVTDWTASYDPTAPQRIPYDSSDPFASNLSVALVNTAYYQPVATPTPSASPTQSASARPTHTASPTHSPTVKATVASTHRATPTPTTLPLTGGTHIAVTAWIGSLLVLIGIWLLVAPTAGRRRRPGQHT